MRIITAFIIWIELPVVMCRVGVILIYICMVSLEFLLRKCIAFLMNRRGVTRYYYSDFDNIKEKEYKY